LENAIRFNESQTVSININCEKLITNEQNDELLPLSEYYKVSVADNGIGFNQHDGHKIFSMFERLHDKQYKGSGTGLAIARKILDAHDGFIIAESSEGNGAAFHCFFPCK